MRYGSKGVFCPLTSTCYLPSPLLGRPGLCNNAADTSHAIINTAAAQISSVRACESCVPLGDAVNDLISGQPDTQGCQ